MATLIATHASVLLLHQYYYIHRYTGPDDIYISEVFLRVGPGVDQRDNTCACAHIQVCHVIEKWRDLLKTDTALI